MKNNNYNDIEQALLSANDTETNNASRSCESKSLAYSLTTIGCASEGAQALFALTEFFGLSNVSQAFAHVNQNDLLKPLMLSYLVAGTLTTSIQSFYLEFPYTFDLFDDPCKLFRQPLNPALHLNYAELTILAIIAFLGAAVRGIVSSMGYFAIANRVTPAITVLIIASALCDIVQTMATDGTFLKKAYMWLRSDRNNPSLQSDLQAFYDDNDSEENPVCATKDSQIVYNSCFILASLSVLGETGLGMIALQQCAELMGFDNQSAGFFTGAGLLSLCYFLLMSAIDSASPAKIITRYYEQYAIQTSIKSIDSKIPSSVAFAAAILCLIGASVKALGAYSGTGFLLTLVGLQDANAIKAISVVIGFIRAGQCLLVEGIATVAQIEKNYSGYQALNHPQPACCAWSDCCSWQSTVDGRNSSFEAPRNSDLIGLTAHRRDENDMNVNN